jgi:hypothetical protein
MTGATDIQTLNPMPKTKLGRYRGNVGAFIIRDKDQVLYVGWANDVYGTCCRYFSKGGPLQNYEIKKASFEVLLCSERKAKKITRILRDYLQPLHNTISMPPKLNRNQKKQYLRLLNLYRQNSFFESTEGEHQSDK